MSAVAHDLGQNARLSANYPHHSQFVAYRAVASMVEETARHFPDTIAIRDANRSYTFNELNSRANVFANQLRALGAAPGVLVALCLERSFEQVASVFATMKTGAAFLPVDLSWPLQRIAAVFGQSQPGIIVRHPGFAVPLPTGATALELTAGLKCDGAAGADQPSPSRPDDLAYVIYTSGSTGTPKGVEICQDNLSNFVTWHNQALAITPADRSAHIAAIGFDAAIWDVWPYLAAGASVCLADDLVRTSPAGLQRWMVEQGITVAFVTTVLAEPMLAMTWPAQTALRTLLTGGDMLRHNPPPGLPFKVVNNYGPTETTIIVTSGEIAPDDAVQPPAIGWPIAGSRIVIVDPQGRPLPSGEVGEIVIGGPGVGRGYHRDPALTAEKFIADPSLPRPLSSRPGARAYRTGDLGCVLPDGRIAFRGRLDQQVKVRGNRVELEEVERAISQCALVSACVVVPRELPGGDRDLVAYLVAKPGGPAPTRALLHDLISMALPSHMVPAAYVLLDCMPINMNGKLDRKSLPEANERTSLPGVAGRAPQTPTEQLLAEIVAGLLRVPSVSAEDNFFALGGHSLLATQVILRAGEAFGVNLTLRHLFQGQTIALLSETIEQLIIEQIEAMSEEDALSLATSG